LTLALLLAGALLAVERACYVWIARAPRSFRAWTARPSVAWLGDPVAVVEKLFFGDRLGYEAPWCSAFPFSVLPHPQYLGAVVAIWAFFAVMRYPHPDWYLLPVVETMYYVAGATLEERAQGASVRGTSSMTRSND